MRCWEPVPRGPVLWAAQAEPWATWVPLLCFVLHVVSWLLIFSILLVFDYAELMGLKQVRSILAGPGSPPRRPHLCARLSPPRLRPETWARGRVPAGRSGSGPKIWKGSLRGGPRC